MDEQIRVQDTQLEPPQAPEVKRRLSLYNFQWIGIPLLLLLPILAILGVFGESFDTINADNEQIAVQVEYPTRFRYKMINSILVRIENVSDQDFDTMTVHFERPYIDQFSTVQFAPALEQITDQSYQIELQDIPAGETRIVTAEIQGEKYGSHPGTIIVDVNDEEILSIDLTTIVFP